MNAAQIDISTANPASKPLSSVRAGDAFTVADTTWYARQESGLTMADEKSTNIRAIDSLASNFLASQEFPTHHCVTGPASALNLEWKTLASFCGLDSDLHPLRAKLQRRRPPLQFRIYTAQVSA
jgi:hypothetical protein